MGLLSNQLAEKDQLRAKQVELEAIMNPIMAKFYQAVAEKFGPKHKEPEGGLDPDGAEEAG
eukprot:808482-Alexandrium_andersonii.AAC.1